MRKIFAGLSLLALGGCVVAPGSAPAPYGSAYVIPYGCQDSGSTISCQRPDGSVSTTTAPVASAPLPDQTPPEELPPPEAAAPPPGYDAGPPPPGYDAGPGYPPQPDDNGGPGYPPPGYDGGPDYPPPPPPGYYGNGY